MSKKSIASCICSCLEILFEKQAGSSKETLKSKEDAIIKDLQNNIDSVLQLIENNSELKALLEQYPECLINNQEISAVCRFTEWLLVFIELLNVSLLEGKKEDLKSTKDEEKIELADQLPNSEALKSLLSISQQKTVKNALQFIVALGILPNLLPGIGVPLERRSEFASLLQKLSHSSSPQYKHRQLVSCVETLLHCLKQDTLQSIILTYYSKDLLGALFQLCYAPIKKIKSDEGHDFAMQQSKYLEPNEKRSLASRLVNLRDISTAMEAELINEMWSDRFYFSPGLENVLGQISQSLLMWDLLIFQGIAVREGRGPNEKKPPAWLKKLCNKLLTDLILQPHGIAKFVQSVLDRASDADMQGGKADKTRLEAVAFLITFNPVKHMPFEIYVEKLSKQVIPLITAKSSMMGEILKYVGSSIVLQFCSSNFELADKYILCLILKPLITCLERFAAKKTNEYVKRDKCSVSEDELTLCIESTYQIFVAGPNSLSEQFISILLPFYEYLWCMFSFMQSGKSFLRSKVKELLLVILADCTAENAVLLLWNSTFDESKFFSYLAYGDDGGVMVSENSQVSPGVCSFDFSHCDAIHEILVELHQRNIKVSYFFMKLLKELTEQLPMRNVCDANMAIRLRKKVIILCLLQKLSDVFSEDLISDISQAVDLINVILENVQPHASENESCVYGNETITIALIILSSLLEYKGQLTSAHWSSLEKCLPSLSRVQKNTTDDFLKNTTTDLMAEIATHGTVRQRPKKPDDDKTEMQGSPKETPSADSSEKETFCKIKKMREKGKGSKSKDISQFEEAMEDLQDPILPVRGHALVTFGKLLRSRDAETISHKAELLEIFKKHIAEDDSFIYLPAIQGLSALAEVDVEYVLPIVLAEFRYYNVHRLEVVLKLGEVLLKIIGLLGDLIVNHKVQLLHAFLTGAKCEAPEVRSSSLSNLGEACKQIKLRKFHLEGHLLQEVLVCATSLLKTDHDMQVRRAAAMVITLLLQGIGKDAFHVLERELKDIYSLVKKIHAIEKDEVLCLHSQLAIEEIDQIVKDMLITSQPLTKEIRILH